MNIFERKEIEELERIQVIIFWYKKKKTKRGLGHRINKDKNPNCIDYDILLYSKTSYRNDLKERE